METSDVMRAQIFEIIDNQITNQSPPETKLTYERLVNEGFCEEEARNLIGQCLSVEIFDAIKYGKPYNNKRYIYNLDRLPAEPYE